MRQTHGAAEKLFVDFAGDTVPAFDAASGGERRAHIFVAVLGASNYTYAEARWSEGLADWIGAHVKAFSAIGGVPKAVVCDNLKAGVTAVCRYEPGINRTYQELAEHYDTAILPTRPRRPRDKAKVEVAVQIVQRFVLARLRNRRFFSLHELNAAIRQTVADLNAKIIRLPTDLMTTPTRENALGGGRDHRASAVTSSVVRRSHASSNFSSSVCAARYSINCLADD
jgi:transposase